MPPGILRTAHVVGKSGGFPVQLLHHRKFARPVAGDGAPGVRMDIEKIARLQKDHTLDGAQILQVEQQVLPEIGGGIYQKLVCAQER